MNYFKCGIYQISIITSVNPTEIVLQCAHELTEYFAGTIKEFSVPIRQKGTEFQLNVWQNLNGIDYGNTISYLDLAIILGDKNLARAMVLANGKNKDCDTRSLSPCDRFGR
ncbi:MAG: MGMT family protein [Ignavibacteria bacterium]|nr:MGMT family protein [Ignavibacteria bacterium]